MTAQEELKELRKKVDYNSKRFERELFAYLWNCIWMLARRIDEMEERKNNENEKRYERTF